MTTSIPVEHDGRRSEPAVLPEPPRPGRERPDRVAMDVSGTATEVFGERTVEYWGALSFMLVEGMTMALVIAAYFYLIGNAETWPPPGIEPPALLWPTLCAVTMILGCIPAWYVYRSACHLQERKVKIGFVVTIAFALLSVVFRFLSFDALHVKWYDSAYGSAAWNVLGWHSALLLPDVFDLVVSAVIFLRGDAEPKHYSAAMDTAMSWWFVTATGVIAAVVVLVVPRVVP